MALAFPLARAVFADMLTPITLSFADVAQKSTSGTRGGQRVSANIGPQLWRGTITLPGRRHTTARALEAMLSLLMRDGASFEIYDHRAPWPAADPGGAILGGAAPALGQIGAENREASLTGLPPGYAMSAGDYIAFGYTPPGGVANRALHRLVSGGVADGTGETPLLEVTPVLRPGAQAGLAVELVRPWCLAEIERARYGERDLRFSRGAEFDWVQVLK